jgi:hypothetical protein
MDEKRKAKRRRVLKSGTIEFERGAYSCAVRNLSEEGAALEVPYTSTIPHEFELVMQADPFRRHCRVIGEKRTGWAWRSGKLRSGRPPNRMRLPPGIPCARRHDRAASIHPPA